MSPRRAFQVRGWRAGRALTISGAVIIAVSGLTSAARAATTATTGATATSAAAKAGPNPLIASGEAGVCAGCTPPLTYHNGLVTGSPTQVGEVTFTPIYWQPAGVAAYNFNAADPTYMSLINRFLADVAAASGTTTNVFANNTQYTQTVNGVTTNIKYLIHAGTPLIDGDLFPKSGQCALQNNTYQPGKKYSACLTDTQIQAELQSFLAAHTLPEDLSHQYPIFFPPGVQTFETGSYSGVTYVGIHQSFNVNPGSGVIYYDDEPYQDNFYDGGTPNNDPTADTAIDVLSHELNESITDATGMGWWDSSGNEIGDECSDDYGAPVGMAPSTIYVPQPYNQVINGDFYYIQREFSNAAYAGLGVGKGCVQTPYTPAAPHALSAFQAHDMAAGPSTVTVDASPANLAADGTATSTITVTALDANGDPNVGDDVHLSVEGDYDTTGAGGKSVGGGSGTVGACGTLSGDNTVQQEGVTDANGQVTVTYTASGDATECYVMATDIEEGTTNETVIYQGADRSDAPSVSQTLPTSLTAGAPPVTFTATATNPSTHDIDDARFDLYLTGDNTATTGIDASQLQLSYSDPATGGAFVDVPLTGTTVGDGEIDGFVIPDMAEALNGGATRTATFRLSLAPGAADSVTTGSPLTVETDLDSFDPADGSQSNLDFTSGDVPVVTATPETVTFDGKMLTSVAPTDSTPGSAVLVADDCTVASTTPTIPCNLTGTATLTDGGGTLAGVINYTDGTAGEVAITFTETFSLANGAGTGTGGAQEDFFKDGSTLPAGLTSSFTTDATPVANVVKETGTIVFTVTPPPP